MSKWAGADPREGAVGEAVEVQRGPNDRGLGSQPEELRFDAAGKKVTRPDFYLALTNTNCFWVALSSFCRTWSAWDTGLFFIMQIKLFFIFNSFFPNWHQMVIQFTYKM